jgi:hypothetical protein
MDQQWRLRQYKKLESRLGTFLGMIEEVTGSTVAGRKVMHAVTANTFVEKSHTAILKYKSLATPVYQILADYPNITTQLDLFFTDKQLWEICSGPESGSEPMVHINSLINMHIGRLDRTILEVTIQNRIYVLKCVKQNPKSETVAGIRTPTQDEAAAYDALPVRVRDLFAKKYAHGRLWFDFKVQNGKINYDTEVILLEKLGESIHEKMSKDMFTVAQSKNEEVIKNSNVMKQWSSSIQMIYILHQNGVAHGDSWLDNFLWTVSGEFKFIDPERAITLAGHDAKTQTLFKMSDIYHILFHHSVYTYFASVFGGTDSNYINFDQLHVRLKLIKNSLDIIDRERFLLDDVIICQREMLNVAIDYLAPTFMQTIENNPQFSRLEYINTDVFIQMLCDPRVLYKTLKYIVVQTLRMNSNTIDDFDKDFPMAHTQTDMKPAAEIPSYTKQRTVVQTTPLTFYGYNLCAPTSGSDFGPLSYTKNGDTLTCYRAGTDGKITPFEITAPYYMRTIADDGSLQMIWQNPTNHANYTKRDRDIAIAGFVPIVFTIQRNPARLIFWYDYGGGRYSVQYFMALP